MRHQRRRRITLQQYKIPSGYSAASLITKSKLVLDAKTHQEYRARLHRLEQATGITIQKLYSVIQAEIGVKAFLDYAQRIESAANTSARRRDDIAIPRIQIWTLLRHESTPPYVESALKKWVRQIEGPNTPAEVAHHHLSNGFTEADRRELRLLLKSKFSWGKLKPGLWRIPEIPGAEYRRPFWNYAIFRLVNFMKRRGVSDRASYILTHRFLCLLFPKVWSESNKNDSVWHQRIRSRYRSVKKASAAIQGPPHFLRLLPR